MKQPPNSQFNPPPAPAGGFQRAAPTDVPADGPARGNSEMARSKDRQIPLENASEMTAAYAGLFVGGVFDGIGAPIPRHAGVDLCREVAAGGSAAIAEILAHQIAAASVMVGTLNCKATAAATPEAAEVFTAAGARYMAEIRRTAESLDSIRRGSTQVIANQVNVAETQQITNVEGPAQINGSAPKKTRRRQRK